MVKITQDLIEQAYQFTNPVRDRELDLRGFKIPVIENMGATLDQFDTIDLSDNDIRRLEGFPLLKRLKCLFFNNNRITRISENLEQNLPSLDTLILTNNNIQELGDIDCLQSVKTLRVLSLLRNPVTVRKHYRLYVVHKIPQLKILDFQKVKLKDRNAAAALFKGKKGEQLVKDIVKKSRTFVPGAGLEETVTAASGKQATAAKQDVESIKAAIASAKTLEEVEHLRKLLQSGQVPGRAEKTDSAANGLTNEEKDEEMEQEQLEEDGDLNEEDMQT